MRMVHGGGRNTTRGQSCSDVSRAQVDRPALFGSVFFFFFFLFLREVGEARRVSGTACFARNRFSAWSQITTGLPKLGREEPTPSGSGRGMIDQCQLKVCPLRLPGENIGDSLTNDAMICCNVRDVVGLCDPRAVSPSSGSSCPLQFKCDELLNRFGTVFRWSQGRRLTRMSI